MGSMGKKVEVRTEINSSKLAPSGLPIKASRKVGLGWPWQTKSGWISKGQGIVIAPQWQYNLEYELQEIIYL